MKNISEHVGLRSERLRRLPMSPVKKAPGGSGAAHLGSLPKCSGPPRRGARLAKGPVGGRYVHILRIARIT